jgi:hypothetical protein
MHAIHQQSLRLQSGKIHQGRRPRIVLSMLFHWLHAEIQHIRGEVALICLLYSFGAGLDCTCPTPTYPSDETLKGR